MTAAANQLTIEAAATAQRLAQFMHSYPIEWAGATKTCGLTFDPANKQRCEAVIIGSSMEGMYALSEAVYGELATLYGPVGYAKQVPAERYYTILFRRVSKKGRDKEVASTWSYMGVHESLVAAIENLPYSRCGAYSQTASPAY
jgi:hypothetical protein